MGEVPLRLRLCQPWLLLKRALRAILAVRLERGSREDADRALMTVVRARERVERAGWFN